MPCNGYVPCQPEHLSPDHLAERIDGAMPCHNYKGRQIIKIVTFSSTYDLLQDLVNLPKGVGKVIK